MSNQEHLQIFERCLLDQEFGHIEWNTWRSRENIDSIDLKGLELNGTILSLFNLAGSNLEGARFENVTILDCNFMKADLTSCKFYETRIANSEFSGSILNDSIFERSYLISCRMANGHCSNAKFLRSELMNLLCINSNLANSEFTNCIIILSVFTTAILENTKFLDSALSGSNFSNSNLKYSEIINCIIFGVSIWNAETKGSIQENLTITNSYDEFGLTVDDIEIAQFIYLLSNNDKVSGLLDGLSCKLVLILGRFTEVEYENLTSIKTIMKSLNYVPVLFDFAKPRNRDLTETIGIIGRMSNLVIADLTNAKSIPQELSELIPHNPSIKFQPLIVKGNRPYSMFEHWEKYPWVEGVYEYENKDDLMKFLSIKYK